MHQAGAKAPVPRFFAGDWAALPGYLQACDLAGSYDLVVSAETIYCMDSLQSLYDCIFAVRSPL